MIPSIVNIIVSSKELSDDDDRVIKVPKTGGKSGKGGKYERPRATPPLPPCPPPLYDEGAFTPRGLSPPPKPHRSPKQLGQTVEKSTPPA